MTSTSASLGHASRSPFYGGLVQALTGVRVLTDGEFECGKLIDHVATSGDVAATAIDAWPNVINSHRLTDHSGVVVTLTSDGTDRLW